MPRMELAMPTAMPEWLVQILTIIFGVSGGGGVAYLGYRSMLRTGVKAKTETEALELLGAAVAHWKNLHDEAWAQVGKERELRELAEQRTAMALADIESLRSEVAALRRQIETLRHDVKSQGDPNGIPPQV